jgi:hypothetical protein
MKGTFQLIDLSSDFAFQFPYFPDNVMLSGRANWHQQETTFGVKPLFYANADPLRVSVREIELGSVDSQVSLKPDIDLLRMFQQELEEGGPPPPMLALWGDQRLRCVLEDLTIEQTMFDEEGKCTRAIVSLELTELQPDGEVTTVRTSEDVDPGGG